MLRYKSSALNIFSRAVYEMSEAGRAKKKQQKIQPSRRLPAKLIHQQKFLAVVFPAGKEEGLLILIRRAVVSCVMKDNLEQLIGYKGFHHDFIHTYLVDP